VLQEWLGKGTFTPKVDEDNKKIILERIDWDELSGVIASDIDRLAKAGRETLQITGCKESLPKASAWLFIQAYYAAFYYSQAIMRACGIIPSYFGPNDLNALRTILTSYSAESPFKLKGALLISVDRTNQTLIIQAGSGMSTHEANWYEFSRFVQFIETLSDGMPIKESEKIQVKSQLEIMKKAIGVSTGPHRKLSAVRNNIQYRQSLGGWHPYTENVSSEDVKRRIDHAVYRRQSLDDFEVDHHQAAIRFLESSLAISFAGQNFFRQIAADYRNNFLKNGFSKLDHSFAA